VCILVLKRCKKPDDVLFINAAEHFEKGKRQNRLRDEDIDKIITTYKTRKPEPCYSRCVEMDEIAKNDYNLNISRYISTAVQEPEIDLAATHADLVRIENDLQKATAKHNTYLTELGLPPLPSPRLPEGRKDYRKASRSEDPVPYPSSSSSAPGLSSSSHCSGSSRAAPRFFLA
jgi:hypothetical protein